VAECVKPAFGFLFFSGVGFMTERVKEKIVFVRKPKAQERKWQHHLFVNGTIFWGYF
jgi:hypothetical protein